MKRKTTRFTFSKATSFTLVELLVVIGIIAILASVVLAGATQVIKKAQRVKASTMASNIQTSVVSYYTEYSVYPVPSTETASKDFIISDTDASDWGTLLYALCGNFNTSAGNTTAPGSGTLSNTRGIAFLSMKKSDVDSNNAPLNPLPTTNANLYFNIAIDGDYDGVLGVSPSAITLPNLPGGSTASGGICTSGVAVWANCNGTVTSTNAAFWVYTY